MPVERGHLYPGSKLHFQTHFKIYDQLKVPPDETPPRFITQMVNSVIATKQSIKDFHYYSPIKN